MQVPGPEYDKEYPDDARDKYLGEQTAKRLQECGRIGVYALAFMTAVYLLATNWNKVQSLFDSLSNIN